jgi:hypothetical protein
VVPRCMLIPIAMLAMLKTAQFPAIDLVTASSVGNVARPGKFLVSGSGGIGTSQKSSLRLLGILIAFRSRLSATTQLPPKARHNSRTALNASEQCAPAPAALID